MMFYVQFLAFGYARYSKGMEKITSFGMRNSVTLPSLGWKYFSSMRHESDESLYTCKDNFLRWLVSQSIKNGRCTRFNQYYKSATEDNIFKTISKELNVKGNICDVFEAYVEYISKKKKTIEEEHESNFDEDRKIDETEEKYI